MEEEKERGNLQDVGRIRELMKRGKEKREEQSKQSSNTACDICLCLRTWDKRYARCIGVKLVQHRQVLDARPCGLSSEGVTGYVKHTKSLKRGEGGERGERVGGDVEGLQGGGKRTARGCHGERGGCGDDGGGGGGGGVF